MNGKNYISTKEQFETLKKFDKTYNNFEISDFDENRQILLFKCKALSEDNKCTQYYKRSIAINLKSLLLSCREVLQLLQQP